MQRANLRQTESSGEAARTEVSDQALLRRSFTTGQSDMSVTFANIRPVSIR